MDSVVFWNHENEIWKVGIIRVLGGERSVEIKASCFIGVTKTEAVEELVQVYVLVNEKLDLLTSNNMLQYLLSL